jgi:hypothetical protein
MFVQTGEVLIPDSTGPVRRITRYVPTATQKKLADIRLPPANRSRRVYLCVAQTQNTPHSRIPLNAPTKSDDQDVEVTEKKQFPVSGFSGGWNLALGALGGSLPVIRLIGS